MAKSAEPPATAGSALFPSTNKTYTRGSNARRRRWQLGRHMKENPTTTPRKPKKKKKKKETANNTNNSNNDKDNNDRNNLAGKDDKEEEQEERKRRLRKRKKEKRPVFLFTAIRPPKLEILRRAVERLHGRVTTEPSECTHLVAGGVRRTVNFLAALSACSYILTAQYVDDSAAASKWLEEGPYALRNPEIERKWGVDLGESLRRASREQVFSGLKFLVTPSVEPPFEEMKTIVECGGGQLRKRVAKGTTDVIVVSCEEDLQKAVVQRLWHRGATIYNKEVILSAAMRQIFEETNPDAILKHSIETIDI